MLSVHGINVFLDDGPGATDIASFLRKYCCECAYLFLGHLRYASTHLSV